MISFAESCFKCLKNNGEVFEKTKSWFLKYQKDFHRIRAAALSHDSPDEFFNSSNDVSVKSICHSLMMRSTHTFVCNVLLNTHNSRPFAVQNDYVIRVRAGHKVSNQRAST